MDTRALLGEVVRLDAALDELVDPQARFEKLASGLIWPEGPVWRPDSASLLFSDIPRNAILEWREDEGLSVYLQPSGYTGLAWYGREPGSNGLTLDARGRLTACEHGDRRISRLEPRGGKLTLADSFEGKRLNSPNDLVYRSNGDLYFSDPAYGLPGRYEDVENRELDFCGVYRVTPEREVSLLSDELSHPNGLAFSPDERILYVSQSNPERALWMAYTLRADGSLAQGEVFHDATAEAAKLPGLPDGLKVDRLGNLFATGPGGVCVFSPAGKLLGRLALSQAASNLAWGDDGSTLYVTAYPDLLRIRTRTRAAVLPGKVD